MVRVLLYHHFGSQDILATDDEPVALYTTFQKVIRKRNDFFQTRTSDPHPRAIM